MSAILVSVHSGQTPPAAWKTLDSAHWGVSIDYPADWTVDQDDEGTMTFQSKTGDTIRLESPLSDNRSDPAPGRRAASARCTTTTTAHAVAATVCVDSMAASRRAVLVLRAKEGAQRRIALTAHVTDAAIFDAIVASVRSYP